MVSLSRRMLILAGVALTALGGTQVEAAPTDSTAFINALMQQAVAILRNTQLSDDARQQQFRTMLDKNFDIPLIARFALGRYWLAASDEDRTTFITLFEQWVILTYSARFKDYSGETIEATGSRVESPTSYVVSSQLIHTNGAPPTTIYWHVHKSDGGFKIVDVEVEGVSMALTEREEIADIIQRSGGSITSLNYVLKNKLNSGETTASRSNGT